MPVTCSRCWSATRRSFWGCRDRGSGRDRPDRRGDVSAQYLENLLGYPDVAVVGMADLDVERARA